MDFKLAYATLPANRCPFSWRMKQESDWKRITLLRKTSFEKEIKNIDR